MKTITVNVTRMNIRNGVRQMDDSCPVALALKHAYPNFFVSVQNLWCDIGNDTFKLPKAAQKFVERFDRGESVYPIKFRAQKMGIEL